ncbi:MAG: sigma 54-interacting transcriptional regulator [Desulfobulbaceae bacterium]|nr:sigma 54-interacting transcriptional regulator [Desulfobulbaceae bacterium]
MENTLTEEPLEGASTAEVKRLVKNWRALLDLMPQMVLLVRDDFFIEYLNRQAKELLGDQRGKRCSDGLCGCDANCHLCPLKAAFSQEDKGEPLFYTKIGAMDVELSVVPFQGYSGDLLRMVLMRDVTTIKRQEQELKSFNNDVEGILRIKINELKENELVRRKLAHEVNILKRKMKSAEQDDGMIGSSRAMRSVREMIYQVADSDANILIVGESGTGKELVADALRAHSSRCDKTFLKVNCSAIHENLLESDLFGYEKGAFTGAAARQKGKFEIVDGGTIFLDEIGDISPRMQASLLRVLQSGELIRVGGNSSVKVDVRILAATNVDLGKAVQEGKFRLDLYYRLNIVQIAIPPLRDRKEDIVELASHFVKHYRRAFKKDIDFLPSRIIDRLLLHDWPGNVRELENVIQRAVLMSKNKVITEQDLVFDQSTEGTAGNSYFKDVLHLIPGSSLKDLVIRFENDVISHMLAANNGNVVQVSRDLDIGKTALYDKMKRLKISAKQLKKERVK